MKKPTNCPLRAPLSVGEGFAAAHKSFRLLLLPSGPDKIRGVLLRRTQSIPGGAVKGQLSKDKLTNSIIYFFGFPVKDSWSDPAGNKSDHLSDLICDQFAGFGGSDALHSRSHDVRCSEAFCQNCLHRRLYRIGFPDQAECIFQHHRCR